MQNKERFSAEFNDFISQCLILDPEQRPTADILLSHPFIKKSQGKKLLAELVANSIDQIEKFREERGENMKNPSEGNVHVRPKQNWEIEEMNNQLKSQYEYNETGTTKIKLENEGEDQTSKPTKSKYVNESGTMIINKSSENSTGKKSEPEESSKVNSGSIIYHAEEGKVSQKNDFELYMKMLREFNQKYEGERAEMEVALIDICKNLTYNQRNTSLDIFVKKKDQLKSEMDAEIMKIKQKFGEKITDINRIIENKQQIELLRTKFKELGTNIEDFDCMKETGAGFNASFKKEKTMDLRDYMSRQDREPFESSSTSHLLPKKLYKMNDQRLHLNNHDDYELSNRQQEKPSMISNLVKVQKVMNSDRGSKLSSRNPLQMPKGLGIQASPSPPNLTPSGLKDKTVFSSTKLQNTKKKITTYLVEKNKGQESSMDKLKAQKK